MKRSIVIVLFIIGLLLTACGGDKAVGDHVVYQQEKSLFIRFLDDDKSILITDSFTVDESFIYDRYEVVIAESRAQDKLIYPSYTGYGIGSVYVYDLAKRSSKLIDDNIDLYSLKANAQFSKFVYMKEDTSKRLYLNDLTNSILVSDQVSFILAVNDELNRILFLDSDNNVLLYDEARSNTSFITTYNEYYGHNDDLSVIYHEEYGDVVANKDGEKTRFIYQVDHDLLSYSDSEIIVYRGVMNIPGFTIDQLIEDDAYIKDSTAVKPDVNQYTDINQYFQDDYEYSTIGERNIIRERINQKEMAYRPMYHILGNGFAEFQYSLSTSSLSTLYLYPTEYTNDESYIVVGRSFNVDPTTAGKVLLSNIYSSKEYYVAEAVTYHYQDNDNIRLEVFNSDGSVYYLDVLVNNLDPQSFVWGTMNKSFYFIDNNEPYNHGDLVKVSVNGSEYETSVVENDVSMIKVIGDEDDILIYRLVDDESWTHEVFFKGQSLGTSFTADDRDRFKFDASSDTLAYVDSSQQLMLLKDGSLTTIAQGVDYIISLTSDNLVYQSVDGSLWNNDEMLVESVTNAYMIR